MNNKRSVMAFSALQILIFHLWVTPLDASEITLFLKQTAYIGVDVFFFVSGYSLAGSSINDYFGFVVSRLKKIYLKFILFSVVAFIYLKWDLVRLLKVIFCVELFEKGGGSFLWFLPAIMLNYIFFPLFQKWDKRKRKGTFVVTFVLWAVIAFVLTRFTTYSVMFIFWNRIPIFLVGYYMYFLKDLLTLKSNVKGIGGFVLLLIGVVLLYQFGFLAKLQVPFTDMFYIMAIPLSVGVALLVDFVPDKSVIKWIGSSTLEIYAVQMIFGYHIANKIMLATKNIVLTNISTLLLVLVISVGIHYLYESLVERIRGLKVSSKA
ncbi:MAG: acyltransferase family protein [Lachnospiraceae bacterium]